MSSIYIEYQFKIQPATPWTEILIAELGEVGFESFVEEDELLLAYILKNDWRESILDAISTLNNDEVNISCKSKEIAQQNWNAEWERNFHPINVGDQCMIRAPFHPSENVEFDIVIEPKMSFGTGHHETTHMMLQHILENPIKGKSVLDMGCGTGVLAILAKMKGATQVDAIDIDEWCFLNSKENVERNNCKIEVYQGDSSILSGKKYDIILANINRNILLSDIPIYHECLNKDGELYLSGFYREDLDVISSKCDSYGLEFVKNLEKNNWVSAKYVN
ncbi:50S ribosomal protein L11 methyltransferase [Flagellimonas algicola]|uniref:Ribosomal protein L11 methyltransferase n=1 Tax=Flagellimonas algicola TaxID=2583815 RepID=A0ABY2WRL1_9FLAO|nr:50S ribosomal protein L11 methyltransferase [Allomuricauda algicola]TMU57380.1 50S ribosomal protein L11 methyltransferase [Allomuricauda algicola]